MMMKSLRKRITNTLVTSDDDEIEIGCDTDLNAAVYIRYEQSEIQIPFQDVEYFCRKIVQAAEAVSEEFE